MIKLPVTQLKPGMKITKNIFFNGNILLLLSGSILNDDIITKLEHFGVKYAYVDEKIFSIEREYIREQKMYAEAMNTVKTVISSVQNGREIDVPIVKDTIDEIIHKVSSNEQLFMQLSGIRDFDNYTFMHSVDVCIYAVIIGKNMNLPDKDIFDLALGALLHDLGKCKVPPEILFKPGPLTDEEFDIIKNHSTYGYEILKNTHGISKRIARIAYQHHEKWNGTGYPLSLRGYEIDEFARIVAIADMYDALTAKRVYKNPIPPYQAASYIANNSSIYVDPEIVKVFINNIAVYPEGSTVLLNTGEIGNITEVETNNALKPKIQVISRRDGPPVLNPYTVDLSSVDGVFIVDILN